jgi:predicted GNAT family N-acyltransferase
MRKRCKRIANFFGRAKARRERPAAPLFFLSGFMYNMGKYLREETKPMITGKLIPGNGDISEALDVRRRVFVEEQGFPAQEEPDEYDARAVHCLLYDDAHRPAATGRLFIDDDGYWRLGRVAVIKEMRGKQLGDLVMRMLLDKALSVGAKRFRLSAQRSAEGFYRLYGFEPYGEAYLDGGVAHVEMEATNESVVRAVFTGCRGSKA